MKLDEIRQDLENYTTTHRLDEYSFSGYEVKFLLDKIEKIREIVVNAQNKDGVIHTTNKILDEIKKEI